MDKKLYTLISEWNLTDASGDTGIQVRIFDSLSYAQEQMTADAECWMDEYDDEEWNTREITDMSIELYETHAYTYNHISWEIREVTIEHDPENK